MTSDDDDCEAFVRRHLVALRRIAHAWSPTAPDADDALQDALESIVHRWSSVHAATDPAAYARVVLLNTLRRRHRFRRTVRQLVETLSATQDPRERQQQDVADAVSDRMDVRAALAGLSDTQRAIVILRYVDDQSVESVAAVLGCSTGAVKKQSSRARARLQAALADRREQPTQPDVSTPEREEPVHDHR